MRRTGHQPVIHQTQSKSYRFMLFSLILIVMVSCGKDSPTSPGGGNNDENVCGYLQIRDNGRTVHFTRCSQELVGARAEWTCSIDGGSGGSYRGVIDVQRDNDGKVVFYNATINGKNCTYGVRHPGKVTITRIRSSDPTSMECRWTQNTDTDFVKYELHVSRVSEFNPMPATKVAEISSKGVTTHTITGLSPKICYYVKVLTYNRKQVYSESGQAFGATLEGAILQNLEADNTSEELPIVIGTGDGGCIIAGSSNTDDHYIEKGFMEKIGEDGSIIWEQAFPGRGWTNIYSMDQDPDGNFILSGESDPSQLRDRKLYLLKTDAFGNSIWENYFDISLNSFSVQASNDGGYIVTGGDNSRDQIVFMKTDGNGDTLWTRRLPRESFRFDIASAVRPTADDGYIIVGRKGSITSTNQDVLAVKTDSEGNPVWIKTYGGSLDDYAASVVECADGGYLILGSTSSFGAGGSDVYLIKIDIDGNVLYEKTFGGREWDFGMTIIKAIDGGYVIGGYTASFGAGQNDLYMIKIQEDGTALWETTFGSAYQDFGSSISPSSDGGYHIAGLSEGKVYLIKTDVNGSTE